MTIKYGPKISASGLVLSLDADNSKSYSGVGNTNTWYDLSGSGNNATRTNNPGYGGQVTFNSSGYFDFTVNPYVQETTEYGYFGGGGFPAVSIVDRIDYSNDTATASPKGPLSAAKSYLGATGNNSYGYFGGGGPGTLSTVDRIDYSNDTATASLKGPLNTARYSLAATGNASYGYFGGGASPSIVSTVDRIDYSNDTATASPKGPLSAARRYLAATGNRSFGYFGGGSPGPTSTVDRIDYSNDTATASPKGPLSSAKEALAATGNSSFGYFGATKAPAPLSTVDRIDYSNDTATASPKGPLSTARDYLAATGNSSFGYFGGGSYLSVLSTVDRIDYSNDTAAASPKGPLSVARRQLAAASPKANAILPIDNSTNGNGFTLSSVTVPTTGGFSISAFIKRDTGARELSDIETIFSNGNGISDGWFFGINVSGNLYYGISGASGVGSQEGSLGGSVADAEWHMVTVVFDRAADLGSYKVYGYVDGVESSNVTITAGAGGNVAFTSNAPGIGYDGFYSVFGGEISNIYSWNRVLTASEVLENYNELKPKYGFL